METKAITKVAGARRTLLAVGVATALVAGARPARAASPCPLGFLSGTTPTSPIDGTRGTTEWNDASLTVSGGGCLAAMSDLESGVAANRNIKVYTKRYTRPAGEGDARYLGFFFEIPDHTPATSGPLPNGERIILQFDQNFSGTGVLQNGSTPATKDRRIEIRHNWVAASGDPNLLVPFNATTAPDGVRVTVFDGSGAAGICTGATWNDVTSSVATAGNLPTVVLRKNTFGGEGAGYQAEIEIPESLFGSLGDNFGVAFAVLNDFATCSSPGVCDGYGVSYPSALPITNTNNPVNACMNGGWRQPDKWATGYTGVLPGDVYFRRDPWWSSSDVDGRRCGVVDNNWYNAKRCKVGIRSWLRNDGTSDQTRNVAYYWAERGMGQPKWHFVSLEKGKTATASTRTLNDSADVSINIAVADHPCARAYILPPALRPDFDESKISGAGNPTPGVLSDADFTALETAYGLQEQHWAQQNITLQATGMCPDSTCYASLLGPLPRLPRELGGAGDAPGPVAPTAPARWLASLVSIPSAYAAEGELVAPQKNPLGTENGTQVLLSAERAAKYAQENVIVQIRGFAYRQSKNVPTPRYNFIEEVGGVIKMFPVGLIKEGAAMPLDFTLGNTADVPRVVMLTVDVQAPPGVVVPPLNIDRTPRVLKPGESTVVKASVGSGGGGECDLICQLLKWLWYILAALILLVLGIVMRVLRRRRPTSP